MPTKRQRIYLRPSAFQLSALEKYQIKRGTALATIVSELVTMAIKGELVLKESGQNYFGEDLPKKNWI